MDALLNFAQPLNSELLDRCVNAVYTGTPAERDQAQRVLTQLQERINSEDASAALNWFRVDLILEQAIARWDEDAPEPESDAGRAYRAFLRERVQAAEQRERFAHVLRQIQAQHELSSGELETALVAQRRQSEVLETTLAAQQRRASEALAAVLAEAERANAEVGG